MNIIKSIKLAKSLISGGPLKQDGWLRSYYEGESIDLMGNPIPWITYSALDFISKRIPKIENVFEYGSGNGTIWWASRSEFVRAVEHDASWYKKVLKLLPKNVELFYQELDYGTDYEEKINTDDLKYDVIVIDGRRRNNCVVRSIKRLKDDGVIILDNSDRKEYEEGVCLLNNSGFRCIDFSGFCPIVNFKSQTSIFYKNNNILGI